MPSKFMPCKFKFFSSIFLVLASTILLAVSGAALFSATAFAEGDSVCKGSITGTTFPGNVNGGVISFDSHIGPGLEDNEGVDLSIIGQSKGLAPGLREHAACVEKEEGTYNGTPYQYSLKGWAWNTNLGFFSFNCKDGINLAGEGDGVECGEVNYGVQVAKPAVAGDPYKLFGYAWNSSFGWVSFSGTGSEILSTDETSLSVATPKIITLNGTSYTVTLTSNTGTSTSSSALKVGSSSKLVKAGETITFGSGNSAVNLVGIEKVGGIGGYFKIKLQTPTSIDFDYGVEVDSNGKTSGYAWTDAMIWLNMEGLTFEFPDSGIVDDGVDDIEGWCEGKTGVCVEISPDPSQLKVDADFSVKTDEEPKIADGSDGYYLHLYLKNSNGTAMKTSDANVKKFTESIKFNWEDTVKINQVDELAVEEELNELPNPWSTTDTENKGKGAITWKPLAFKDFDTVPGDTGHYISKKKIASYAPTTESNVSYTTSTKPVYTVKNEAFLYDIGVGGIEENKLILKYITFDELKDASGNTLLKQGVVYPNGKTKMPFKFMPAVNVDTLYAGTAQDNIMAYRSIPENIKVGVKLQGNLPTDAQNTGDVVLKLKYSVGKTLNQSCVGDFDFHFLTGLNGEEIKSDDTSNSKQKTVQSGKILDKIWENILDMQIIAELPGYDKKKEEYKDIVPCTAVPAPALYSEIAYQIAGNTVKYFGNKLPRIAGSTVFNPIVVVHGNIAGQMNVDIRYNPVNQITRNIFTNDVRDTIHRNLAKRMGGGTVKGGGSCKVTKLVSGSDFNAKEPSSTGKKCDKNYYKKFLVGDENVLYFRDSDVFIELDDKKGNIGTFSEKWVIVSDGGNIFINNDIYNKDSSDKTMVLVTFHSEDNEKTKDVNEYFTTGNIYISPCKKADGKAGVKNIQAIIFADGTVFSYNENESPLNEKGEPQWNSYSERINALNCQLLIEGAVYSKNTIGGADLDKVENPKEYLLLGGGEVILLPVSMEERMRAQAYDLNYLRTFRLDLEVGKNGCPIDQKCGKALCAEEIKKIANGETVCGDKPCDPSESAEQKHACDGINPFEKFSEAVPNGDLVLPENSESTAKGLDPDTDLESVYVFQKVFEKDPFVFTK